VDDRKQRLKRLIRELSVEGDRYIGPPDMDDEQMNDERHRWRLRVYDLTQAALGTNVAALLLDQQKEFPQIAAQFRAFVPGIDAAKLEDDFDPAEWESKLAPSTRPTPTGPPPSKAGT
jgi:hypothetical protein